MLFLPIVVLWLATWYVKHEVGAEKVDLGKVLFAKFPVFVLGFPPQTIMCVPVHTQVWKTRAEGTLVMLVNVHWSATGSACTW